MPQLDFRAEAEALFDEMVQTRRDIHRHPELGFEEVRTSGLVAERLNELGFEVQRGIGQTGPLRDVARHFTILATGRGALSGAFFAFREYEQDLGP